MAKMSSINKNNRRIKLSNKFYKKRDKLKKIIMNKKLSLEERFKAQQKLSKLPRNSAKVRVMNRCQITGRPHGVYRKLKISRIALRQLGLQGKIPAILVLKFDDGKLTFLWFLDWAFFTLAIISPIGSLKLIISPFYQLDFTKPGIFPCNPSCLNAILEIFNFL